MFLGPGVVVYEDAATNDALFCPGWEVNCVELEGGPCMPMMVDPGAWISSIVTPM